MRKLVVFGALSLMLLCGQVVQANTNVAVAGPTSDPVHVTHCQASFGASISNPNTNDYPLGPLPSYDVASDVYPPGDLSTVSPNSVLSQYPYGPANSPRTTDRRSYLAIDYTNKSKTTLKTINFGLIVRGNLIAEIQDKGSALPGVDIERTLALDASLLPLPSNAECVPLEVTYDDGTQWANPQLQALRKTNHTN